MLRGISMRHWLIPESGSMLSIVLIFLFLILFRKQILVAHGEQHDKRTHDANREILLSNVDIDEVVLPVEHLEPVSCFPVPCDPLVVPGQKRLPTFLGKGRFKRFLAGIAATLDEFLRREHPCNLTIANPGNRARIIRELHATDRGAHERRLVIPGDDVESLHGQLTLVYEWP